MNQLHERHADWIEARGISAELAASLGLYTKHEGGKNWLAVPYQEHGQVVNHKLRLTTAKDHRMDPGAPLTLWNHDALLHHENEPVIVTEGEWDALAAMTAGLGRVVSVPNGAPATVTEEPGEAKRYEFLWRAKPLLDRVATFILATDADEPGRALAADLARLLGPERCRSVQYPDGCKDLNEVLTRHGQAAVVQVVRSARAYPVRGLYQFDEIPEPPAVDSIRLNIEGLADRFPLALGTFSVITGLSGIGKTSLLCFILADLLKQGVRMAVGSFETSPKPILQRKMRATLHGVHFDHALARSPGRLDELLNDRFRVIAQNCADEETEFDLETLLETAKIAVLRDNVRLIVIDPWNEIEHRRNGDETEHEYTGRAIRAIKRFARQYQVAVWLVAHPKKPPEGKSRAPGLYDVSGSAHFANKADYGISIHRDDQTKTLIDFMVIKVRMGLPGKVGRVMLDYDDATSSYQYIPSFSEMEAA